MLSEGAWLTLANMLVTATLVALARILSHLEHRRTERHVKRLEEELNGKNGET